MVAHDGLICIISDLDGENDETRRLVTRLCAHNDVLAVFIQDPLEQQLPDVGRATFSSGQAQIEVDASGASLRQRFSDERAAWRARLAELSRSRAIPVLAISPDRDVADQMRELIGRRQAQKLASASGRAP